MSKPEAFQSTRPVWAATFQVDLRGKEPFLFQSTRPVWAATRHRGVRVDEDLFQSTRPVWAATLTAKSRTISSDVSIHAARVGRDALIANDLITDIGFNPRGPCGPRPAKTAADMMEDFKFQSTRPVWAATRR